MKFGDAQRLLADHEIAIIFTRDSGICGLPVGREDGGPLTDATDNCVTPACASETHYGPTERSEGTSVFASTRGNRGKGAGPDIAEIDVVEAHGYFQTQATFSIPNGYGS